MDRTKVTNAVKVAQAENKADGVVGMSLRLRLLKGNIVFGWLLRKLMMNWEGLEEIAGVGVKLSKNLSLQVGF